MNKTDFRDQIEAVRERTDIVEVIAEKISLNRQNKALCPFHEDKTPSFSVNPDGQYFYCFGCGVGGDVFKFLELYENKPFVEVLSDLAGQVGLPFSDPTPEERKRIENGRIIEYILTETAGFYHRNLTPQAREYLLQRRGFSENSISRFRIGYAGGGLRKHLLNGPRFPLEICLESGVLKENDDGAVRDYFYDKVIFPTLDRGRVVYLTGRRLDGKEPKYLHLPGQIRHLYNQEALANREICLVEGIPDCISAVQIGYPTAAVLGSVNFKPEYLPKFSRCETVYICFDGDEAGKTGALKTADLIGERARIVQLPDGCDVNEFLRDHSKEDFDALVASAADVVKHMLSQIAPDTNKTHLPSLLDPVFKKLARLERAKAEPYLKYEIKPRFGLTNPDIDAYRGLVNQYRKADSEPAKAQTSNHSSDTSYTAYFDGLIDIVEHNGDPAFLIREGDNLKVVSDIELDGVSYAPPVKSQIPWILPRGEEVLNLYELQQNLPQHESNAALYQDLLTYHKAISELPAEEFYDLLVAWDLHTYLLEAFQYSPVVCLFAVPERGKSRTGKGMIQVAYRGIHVESLRDAYLVRVANDLKASLFFDVKDIWRKAEKNGSEDILLHRYERGAKVPRVLYPDRGAHRDIVYYSIFGPTIIGTNEGVHKILETRAVSINMPETSKQFENDVTPELSLPLKERLVVFRARHLGMSLPDMPKPAPGRLGDILKSLHQIIRSVEPDREPSFLRLVRELQADRMVEKADSFEAQILEAVCRCEEDVSASKLAVKVVTEGFNQGKSDKDLASSRTIGRRLKAMGFRKSRMGDGSAALIWDRILIDRLKETYGLNNTSETSETPNSLSFNELTSEVTSDETGINQ
jgi:DNA primase catalytic core